MINVPYIFELGIILWGVLLFLTMIFLAFRILLKNRTERIKKAEHLVLMNELTEYLATEEFTPLLLSYKNKPKYAADTLLTLLEKFRGADYDNLKLVISKLKLQSWIIKNLKKRNPKKVQPALLLAKHANDPSLLPAIKKQWKNRNTITRLLAKQITVKIGGVTQFEPLFDSLLDESFNSRKFLVEAVVEYRNVAPPFVLTKFHSTKDPELQIPLIWGLKELFVTDAVEPLSKLLGDTENNDVQIEILLFFAVVTADIANDLFYGFLTHPNERTRKIALIAFLRQESDLDYIAAALDTAMHDKSWFIRYYALHRWVQYFEDKKPPTEDMHLYARVKEEEALGVITFGVGVEG